MAASKDPQSSSDSDDLLSIPDLIKCTICFGKLSSPRVLPCFHSFCQQCLQLYMESYAKNPDDRLRFLSTRTFPCPTCREKVDIPAAGVKGFRHDFRFEQIDDFIKSLPKPQNTSQGNVSGAPKLCEVCTHKACTKYCVNCRKYYCRDCSDAHLASPLYKHHQVQSSEQHPDTGVCKLHIKQHLNLFCLTCNKAVCDVCSVTSHETHNVTDIRTGLEGFHANASKLCNLTEARLNQLKAITKQLSTCEKHVKTVQKETKRKVRQHAEDLIQGIRTQEHRIIHGLSDRCKEHTDRITSIHNEVEVAMVSLQSMFDLVKDLTSKQNEVTMTLVPVYREVITRMEQLLETSHIQGHVQGIETLDVTFKFSPSSSKVRIGKVLWGEQPISQEEKLVTTLSKSSLFSKSSNMLPFRPFVNKTLNTSNVKVTGREGKALGEFHMPKDLCFLSDGRIIVADTGNDRLQLLDPQGQPEKILCADKVRPWGVTTDKEDNFYVADAMGKCITIIDKTGVILKKIGKFMCPCGIALTHSEDVLVTDFFSPSLYIMGKDGDLLNQFDFRGKQERHASGTSYVSVSSSGKVIISDVSNHSVKLYTLRGTRLTRISKSSYKTQESELSLLDNDLDSQYARFTSSFCPQGVAVLGRDILVIDGAKCSVNVHSEAGTFLTSFLSEKEMVFRGLNGVAVLPWQQRVAMTDVLSHQVVLLQQAGRAAPPNLLHSIVGKLPKNVVNSDLVQD